MITVTPPERGRMGARIEGIDARRPLAAGDRRDLLAALYEHGVVCLPDQSLSPGELEAFGAQLGTPIQHVEEDLRMEGAPGVMSLSNADGRPERQRNGGAFWHTDLVFTEEPASFTMLNAVAVPRAGGETRFADSFSAFDDLPEETRIRIEPLTVAHCYEGRTDGSMPTVHQPLVRPHPVTGRKALYGAAGTCLAIDGMAAEEGRALLSELGRHAVAERYQYVHHYAPKDLVIWDNASTLHRGPTLEEARGAGEARVMHRCSVRGWPEVA